MSEDSVKKRKKENLSYEDPSACVRGFKGLTFVHVENRRFYTTM